MNSKIIGSMKILIVVSIWLCMSYIITLLKDQEGWFIIPIGFFGIPLITIICGVILIWGIFDIFRKGNPKDQGLNKNLFDLTTEIAFRILGFISIIIPFIIALLGAMFDKIQMSQQYNINTIILIFATILYIIGEFISKIKPILHWIVLIQTLMISYIVYIVLY